MITFQQRRKIAISSLKKHDIDISLMQIYNPRLTRLQAIEFLQKIMDNTTQPDPLQLAAFVLKRNTTSQSCYLCAKMMLGLNEKSTRKAYRAIIEYID